MKKCMLLCVLAMVLILLLAGCGCSHEWLAATCAAPKTCILCGATEGEALPHTWAEATCSDAKTCSVCKTTEGEALPHTWTEATCNDAKTCSVCKVTEGDALGHTWADATCTTPKTCSVCQLTEGEPADHTWVDATCTVPKTCSVCQLTEGNTAAHKWLAATTDAPKTCSVCSKTSGSKLQTDPRFTTKSTQALQGTWICNVRFTDEMLGLPNFGGEDCRVTMKFGNTGELTMYVRPENEKTFLEKYKTYCIDLTYAIMAEQGLSKPSADAAMLQAYGMTVDRYVEAQLKNYKIEDMFVTYNSNEVYYVQDGKIFTALAWDAKFESNSFTIAKNGKLQIDGLTLGQGESPVTWTKA